MTQNACVLFTRPRIALIRALRPLRKGGVEKAIFPSRGGGGTTEWWGGSKSIRVKIANARAHWDTPQFYPLQENQGFFATHFFTKMKKFFGGFPPFFNFANCPKIGAKKPWFFYDVHE